MVSIHQPQHADSTSLPPRADGRTRYVPQEQVRGLENGPPSTPPRGHRTPNGLIWGRRLTDFYWVGSHPIENTSNNASSDDTETNDDPEIDGDTETSDDIETNDDSDSDSDSDAVDSKTADIWSTTMFDELANDSGSTPDAVIRDQQKPSVITPWSVLRVEESNEPCVVSFSSPQTTRTTMETIVAEKNPNGIAAEVCCDRAASNTESAESFPDTTSLNMSDCNSCTADNNAKAAVSSSDLQHTGQATIGGGTDSPVPPSSSMASDGESARRNAGSDATAKLVAAGSAPSADATSDAIEFLNLCSCYDSICTDGPEVSGTAKQPLTVPPYYGSIPRNSPFYFEDLPKLEEFVPEKYLPETLEVHDPCWMLRPYSRKRDSTELQDHVETYKRIFPPPLTRSPEDVSGPSPAAELHLHRQMLHGTGSHSYVFRAPLTLPAPLSARSRDGRVSVAVKTANGTRSSEKHLLNEGQIYNKLPRHLMEDWDGFNIVPPLYFPVPVGPVVPKCYGFYLPTRLADLYDGDVDSVMDEAADYPTPILLLEECGKPIKPATFTLDQRSECYSLLLRLNHEGFTQGSYYERNILVQPGPLSVSPSQRSMDTPSFRIVDFGRGKCDNHDDDIDVSAADTSLNLEERDWIL